MRSLISAGARGFALLLFSLLWLPAVLPQNREEQADYYRKWLEEDVAYIVTDAEREVFSRLSTDPECEQFIEQFWQRRDGDRLTAENEFKVEHYRRLAYANDHFTAGIPGWKTDRGRIYILHGPPDQIYSHPGGQYLRDFTEGGGQTSVYPFQRWWYRHVPGVGGDVEIEFVDKGGDGLYRIALDPRQKDELLQVPNAGLTAYEELAQSRKDSRVLGYPVGGSLSETRPMERLQDQPLERILTLARLNAAPEIRFRELKELVDARITYGELPLQIRTDTFAVTATGAVVALSLAVNNVDLSLQSSGRGDLKNRLQIYGRLEDVTGRVIGEFEDEIEVLIPEEQRSGISLYRKVIPLDAGIYKLHLITREEASGRISSQEIRVAAEGLQEEISLSPLMLATRIEPLAAVGQSSDEVLQQAIFGNLKIWPSFESRFSRGQVLGVYCRVSPTRGGKLPPETRVRYSISPRDSQTSLKWRDITRSLQEVGPHYQIARLIDLAALSPGAHVLRLELLTPNGEKRSQSVHFEVAEELP